MSAPPLTPGSHRGDDEAAGARAAGLIAVAEDLAGEFSLRPLLERILLRCTELLGCDAGSICSVDEAAGTYRKEADIGVACQSGHVFPLTEGMMEMGVGIHGEPGRRREKLASANEIVDELLEAVVTDLPFSKGDDVALMVNGTSITLSRLDSEIDGLLGAPAAIAIRTF